jgi:hypothetical protein
MNLPESREARYTQRGKAQTSYWKARSIAEQSLVVRRVAPRAPKTQKELDKLNEERIGSFWKPKKPMIFAKLDMKPFQSKDQFMRTLETDYVEEHEEKSTSSVTSPRASGMRALQRAQLFAEFEDI